jgi:hypothetical protein
MRRSRVAGTRRRRRPASLWHLRVRVAAPALRLHVQIWLLGPNRLWRVFRHWRETGRISSNSAEPARRSRRGRTLTYILHHSAAPEKWWASSPLTQRGRLTAGRRRLLTVRRAQATNPSRSTSGASTGIVQLFVKACVRSRVRGVRTHRHRRVGRGAGSAEIRQNVPGRLCFRAPTGGPASALVVGDVPLLQAPYRWRAHRWGAARE